MKRVTGKKGVRRWMRPIGLLAPLSLGLAGCAGTLHNRWASETDTLSNWQDSMASMPVEIHGHLEGKDAATQATDVPHGITTAGYLAQNPGQPPLDTLPRILLYVGGHQIPSDQNYCSTAPAMRSMTVKPGRIDVAAALCDGLRLVVTARYQITPQSLDREGEAAIVDQMKEHLMFALATNPKVPSMGQ
ncbi:hypothetical protein ACYJW8_13850 [Frateuria aurantia]